MSHQDRSFRPHFTTQAGTLIDRCSGWRPLLNRRWRLPFSMAVAAGGGLGGAGRGGRAGARVGVGRGAGARAVAELAARVAAERQQTRVRPTSTISPGRLSRNFLPALLTTNKFCINSPTALADLSSSIPTTCWAVWKGLPKIKTSTTCWATSLRFQTREVATA